MKNLYLMLAALVIVFATIPLAQAADSNSIITLNFNTSRHFKFHTDVLRVVVGSEEVIKVSPLPPAKNEFLITSQEKSGTTTLLVWTVDGAKYEYFIHVEDSGLSEIIERMINLPDVHVKKVDDRILLTGTVKNQYERNYAIQTARLYTGGSTQASLNFGSTIDPSIDTQAAKDEGSSGNLASGNQVQSGGEIIDLLQILNPTKIRFEAQIVEITSDNAKDLGIQYGRQGTGGVFQFGEDYDRTQNVETYRYYDSTNNRWDVYTISSGSHVRNFGNNPVKWLEQRFAPINAQINALVSKGKARVLSRPNITTLAGEEAAIQVGGEIPYTVVGVDGFATTDFKNYGIILQLKPIVDSENRITSAIHTEVSNLSGQTVNGLPVISTRRADTVMTLQSGATMIVGGLMDSTESKAISKIPLLGDIPIIGEFFKYTSKRKEKRELIILITPYIVSDDDTYHSGMSDDLQGLYQDGQREQNNLHDVDLNEPPPPLPEKFEQPKPKKTKFVNPNKRQKKMK